MSPMSPRSPPAELPPHQVIPSCSSIWPSQRRTWHLSLLSLLGSLSAHSSTCPGPSECQSCPHRCRLQPQFCIICQTVTSSFTFGLLILNRAGPNRKHLQSCTGNESLGRIQTINSYSVPRDPEFSSQLVVLPLQCNIPAWIQGRSWSLCQKGLYCELDNTLLYPHPQIQSFKKEIRQVSQV